jgi:hypothetical protein
MPLDPAQRDAYLWFLGDGGEERVGDFLQADGEYRLSFVADQRQHEAVIRRSR